MKIKMKKSSNNSLLMIKVREVEIVKEVKGSDSLWRLACGDVFFGGRSFTITLKEQEKQKQLCLPFY